MGVSFAHREPKYKKGQRVKRLHIENREKSLMPPAFSIDVYQLQKKYVKKEVCFSFISCVSFLV